MSWSIEELEKYLLSALPSFCGPLRVQPFSYGQSNPTYRLISPSGSLVLRKKPAGKLAASAHAIEREYTVLKALESSDVPVPTAYVLCTDDSVIGTPFYIMEYVPGRIFTDPALPELSPRQRRQVYMEAIQVLHRIHNTDIATARLGALNSAGGAGYYARQLRRLSAVAGQQAAHGGAIPHASDMCAQLQTHAPEGKSAILCTLSTHKARAQMSSH